jgi:hypothetical protein
MGGVRGLGVAPLQNRVAGDRLRVCGTPVTPASAPQALTVLAARAGLAAGSCTPPSWKMWSFSTRPLLVGAAGGCCCRPCE